MISPPQRQPRPRGEQASRRSAIGLALCVLLLGVFATSGAALFWSPELAFELRAQGVRPELMVEQLMGQVLSWGGATWPV